MKRDGESGFASSEIFKEIGDLNLAYMLLAQKLIVQNKADAMLRLGIGNELADLMASMSPEQVVKLSASNLLLCSFSLGDQRMFAMVGKERSTPVPQLRASLLAAARPLPRATA